METPKEIYVALQYHPQDKSTSYHASIEKTTHPREEKYIRADLAELTWEDMKQIDLCFHEVATEHTMGKLKLHSFQEMYEEVLRRFLENKREE